MTGPHIRLKIMHVHQRPENFKRPCFSADAALGSLKHNGQGRLLAYEQDSPGPQIIREDIVK